MNKGLARALMAVALVAAIALALLLRDGLDPAALEAWVAGAGAAGPLLFIVIYALATVVFLPGAALTLVGGALFGPVAGTLYNLTGALVYTYLGYAGREALAGSEGLLQKGFIALSLLGALAFLPRLVARLRARPLLGVEELKRRLDEQEDLLLLDVRTAADFVGEQRHIAGATNIPLEALESRLDELTADLARPIALLCRTDRRSAKAAALLTRRGFADVHVVQGGMTAWLGNGWAVEDANPRPE